MAAVSEAAKIWQRFEMRPLRKLAMSAAASDSALTSDQPPVFNPDSPWEPQPAGAAWVAAQVDRLRRLNPYAEQFAQLLCEHTGTRLIDWIDHMQLTDLDGIEEAGFRSVGDDWYEHPGALLPAVRLAKEDRMLLRVDSVSDFVIANSHRFPLLLDGTPLNLRRTAVFAGDAEVQFGAIERHGCNARSTVRTLTDKQRLQVVEVREQLRHRRRIFDSDDQAWRYTTKLVQQSIDLVGRNVTCDLFFEGERCYWQSRNRAARIQFMRQAAVGVGWGNHDHHTYRSSRPCFHRLVALLELMGFHCRERFHAGAQAGWGAQVLEQPVCGVVIFADVDLKPEEITGDIAHHKLEPLNQLGTIGLWCALHGEAMFEAGMHHLECQFDFDGARSQLQQFGVSCMKPFTDFPFLRQCFTEGEQWAVDSRRIENALSSGWINAEQAARFKTDGAVGSHMEILERNDGYRGFNQTGINEIIRKTDPRFLTVK